MSADLPFGYRWADPEELDREDAIVVRRTVDSEGVPYTQDEADIAVPLSADLREVREAARTRITDDWDIDTLTTVIEQLEALPKPFSAGETGKAVCWLHAMYPAHVCDHFCALPLCTSCSVVRTS